MVEFNSYVIEDNKTSLIGKKDNLFISIQEYKNNEKRMKKILSNDYINGYIDLEIDGKQVLNEKYWDNINCLWSYIIDALYQLLLNKEKKVSFTFPDQPLVVEFELDNSFILLHVDNKVYSSVASEFINSCLCEARNFFVIYNQFNDKYDFTRVIIQINELIMINEQNI